MASKKSTNSKESTDKVDKKNNKLKKEKEKNKKKKIPASELIKFAERINKAQLRESFFASPLVQGNISILCERLWEQPLMEDVVEQIVF
jgi:hypothetical protein